jgi:tetratricopeptide (TPR) repeat protein
MRREARPRREIRTRTLFFALAATLLLAGAATQAEELDRPHALQALSGGDAPARRDAVSRLGEIGTMADARALVTALRDRDEETRNLAEDALWHIWARSGDEQVDRLYRAGVEQMTDGDLQRSIATFTRIIELKPAFAEGWNKRATLYFLTGDLRKSLADCDEVMKRNPYHFGALAGYAQIYARLEYYERALDYSRRALAINPNLDGVRHNIKILERLVEERRGRMI